MPYLVTQLEPGGERHYIDGVAWLPTSALPNM
jgi:hypothetical protein